MRCRNEAKEAKKEEHGAQSAETVEVERSSSNTESHQEPRTEHADHVDPVLPEREVVARRRIQSRSFEEVRRVAGEGVAGKILDGPDHADDFGAPAVRAAEAIEVGGTFGDFLLEGGRVHHHGDGLVGVKFRFAVQGGEAEKGFLRVFGSSLAH